jgi:peptide deformylase
MATILQEPNAVLRQVAAPVPASAIGSAQLNDIIARMKTALAAQDDGVAIAAPQIGESLRIFVVARRVSKKPIKELEDDMVFINPEIIRLGKKKDELSEGCLSVRWKYGLVKRSITATVRAQNEQGHEFVMSGSGLLAQIFQHEIDHLNGILFIDKATHIEDHPPTEHAKR